LVAFGGAGGLHACSLARALGFTTAIVPRNPGLLSALGMLHAEAAKDFSRTVLVPMADWTSAARKRAYCPLQTAASRLMREEGFRTRDCTFEHLLDVRYVGQSYELTVPDGPKAAADFHKLHERRYGHADEARPIEVVTVRLRARARVAAPPIERIARAPKAGKPVPAGRQRMVVKGRAREGLTYERESLQAGHRLAGPALVTEMSGTTVVLPDFSCRVDALGNLILEAR